MKAPRELIEASKQALGALALAGNESDRAPISLPAHSAYLRLAKALENVRPDDEPEFRSTCPAYLSRHEPRHD